MTHATYNPWGEILIDVDPRANCKKSETYYSRSFAEKETDEVAIKGNVSSRKDFFV